METIQCIEGRRSVRRFKQEQIPEKTLEELVSAASYAPSWKNTQTVRYTAIYDQALIARIANEAIPDFPANQKTILGAPVLIVVTTVDKRSGYDRDGTFSTSKGTHWQSFDAGLSVQTFCLAAHDKGIGTVVLGIYDEAAVSRLLDIPEGESVSALIPLGYPNEEPHMPLRKTTDILLRIIK